MKLYFRWVKEERPGRHWQELFERAWPSYRRWFLREGEAARPVLATCRRRLGECMPELVPTFDHLTDLSAADPLAARMLALWRPAPYLGACSQAIWLDDEPFLIRNYDFHPHASEGLFLESSWHGRNVVATSDCLWGALDGMNEAGLVAALSFGGRRVKGKGFGIPIILRYLLEFCSSVPEAIQVLKRVPSHMSYNVTLLDREARHAVVALAPDRPTVVHRRRISTNHQEGPLWKEYQRFSKSEERETFLKNLLRRSDLSASELQQRFLEPPLFATEHARGAGTLYTILYRPTSGRIEYLWLRGEQTQKLGALREGQIEVRYR